MGTIVIIPGFLFRYFRRIPLFGITFAQCFSNILIIVVVPRAVKMTYPHFNSPVFTTLKMALHFRGRQSPGVLSSWFAAGPKSRREGKRSSSGDGCSLARAVSACLVPNSKPKYVPNLLEPRGWWGNCQAISGML
jgi:hypothetical protein